MLTRVGGGGAEELLLWQPAMAHMEPVEPLNYVTGFGIPRAHCTMD